MTEEQNEKETSKLFYLVLISEKPFRCAKCNKIATTKKWTNRFSGSKVYEADVIGGTIKEVTEIVNE